MQTIADIENRTVTGQWNGRGSGSRHAKTHQDYWKRRIKRRPFRGPDGTVITPPEFSVRMFHLGRETWFNLATANQSKAALKARQIYLSLISAGWDATLARFKPSPIARSTVATLGEFLTEVERRSHLKPMTVRRYAVKIRKIVADIAKVDAGVRGKALRSKYDYVNGGRKAWLEKVDGQRVDVLTPESLSAWRNAYTARTGENPIKRRSAERSAASCLRCARALFSPEILSVLRIPLPPNPFAGVKVKDPGPQRYLSEVSPEWLLAAAGKELRLALPQQYLALSLCLWAGLRRREADLLMWTQVDLEAGLLEIRRTEWFEPKTDESQRRVDLAPEVVTLLKGFKDSATSPFVLEGSQPNPKATYDYYRCDGTWRALNKWLRAKGVRQVKAVHSLRKESGSLIASAHGIEAARQHLGHRDIRTTSAHYVTKKKRVEVCIPLKVAG